MPAVPAFSFSASCALQGSLPYPLGGRGVHPCRAPRRQISNVNLLPSFLLPFLPLDCVKYPPCSFLLLSVSLKRHHINHLGFGGKGNEPKAVAQVEMGKRLWAPLPSLGRCLFRNKEGRKSVCLLSGARRSTFTTLSHNTNSACFNMTLAMELNFNGTENINRVIQTEIQMQQQKPKESTHISRGSSIEPIYRVTNHYMLSSPSPTFRSVYLHKFGFK